MDLDLFDDFIDIELDSVEILGLLGDVLVWDSLTSVFKAEDGFDAFTEPG